MISKFLFCFSNSRLSSFSTSLYRPFLHTSHRFNAMSQNNDVSAESELFRAVETNDMELLRQTLKAAAAAAGGASDSEEALKKLVNTKSPVRKDRTPLHIAVWSNNIEAAKLLVEAGADVNVHDGIKDSPFLLCGAEGNVEIMRCFLDNAAKTRPDTTTVFNRFGGTALIPACERGHAEMVRLLLERRGTKYGGADGKEEYVFDINVNHINNLKWTGLLEVTALGCDDDAHVEVARLLLEHGADVNIADGEGHTTLYYAEQKNFPRLATLLKAAGGASL